jgi:HAD superfamily hydrolase (TIGR01509 family)
MEALLFDLDGVLVDSFAAWHKVLNLALAERGLPPIDDAQMRAGWGQGIQEDSRHYFRGEPVESLAATFDRLFPTSLERITLMPGAGDMLAAVAGGRFRMAVVTNTPRELAVQVLTRTGIARYFDALACGDEVPLGKPDPAILRLASSRIQVPLTACLFVGDTVMDVEAGRRAPCLTVGLGIDADLRINALPELLALLPR